MDIKSGALDFWRTYFRNANSDIFEVIDYAILIAASDCPNEFRLRQGQIAEKLFSCGCQHVELAVPEEEGEGEGNEEDNVFKNSCRGGRHLGNKQSKMNNDSETLTVEIEEESETVGLVLRIKGVLDNHQEEADGVLFDCLRRLQLMKLTVETLQETQIGKTVYSLRKHGLKQIQHLARDLIKGWKQMVDEWINDLDDFADPLNNGDLDKNCENGREPTLKDHVQIKPSNFDSKMTSEHKADGDAKSQQRKDLVEVQTKPPATNVQDKSNNSNEILSAKLEAPKRKLHEQYQQLENAKKQRKIHITELHDLPKQGLGNKKFHTKPGFNKYRNRSNVLPL